jgi:DNA-binding PadR family transcriptional regulator
LKKSSSENNGLFRRGNITLIRLLIAVYAAGPKGITTMDLLRQLRTIDYGQTVLSRAVREGLIEREVGKSEHGHFKPVYNRITDKGRQVLQSQLAVRIKEERGE